MEICRLESVSKEYKVMTETILPVHNLSLIVNSGDFITIEGPSGIGKSTMLYLLGMLLQSDSGKYFFEGKEVSKLSDNEHSELRAKNIGFIFQDPLLIQSLTVKENLLFAQKINLGGHVKPELVEEALASFGLSDRANSLPYQLSGGQRRRAMAARCLSSKPKLILADEPTNDLDPYWAEQVMNHLKKAASEGSGVVMVTHQTQWSHFANQRYRLEDGQLRES